MPETLPLPRSSPLRRHAAALLLISTGLLGLGAFLLTVVVRLDLTSGPGWPLVALALLALCLVAAPLRTSHAIFLALPLFGNHPGGSLMELLNVPLAGSIVGLSIRAWRLRRDPPGGLLWVAAGLLLSSSLVSLVPALPGVLVNAAQVDDFPATVVQALTAAETVPLYSIGSLVQLVLAVAWAYSLCWAGADRAFAHDALRYTGLGLFAVMLLGALDFHRVIALREALERIDPQIDFLDRFQSVFWNPGWFAWYFAIAFGLTLGLLWLESGRLRLGVGAGLAFSYLYVLTNSQRGGFLAVHAVILVALVYATRGLRPRQKALLAGAAAVALALGLAFVAAQGEAEHWLQGLHRLVTPQKDINRRNLWIAAIEMWRTAPLFGLGEGTFGWRYRDFIPVGSRLDIGAWGDAHNTWLQILASRGLFGLGAYVALLIALARRLIAAARVPEPSRGLGMGLGLGLLAFLIYSCVQWMFYLQSIQVLIWGIVALAAIVRPDAAGAVAPSTRPRWLVPALAVVALGGEVASTAPQFREAADRIARQPRGFYGLARAGSMRFSSRKGTLCLYPSAPVMTIEVGTIDPRAATRPVTVTLSVNGRLVDRFELRRGGLIRSVFLPEALGYRPPEEPIPFGECRPDRASVPLTVEVSRLWSPSLRGSSDGRLLGAAVFKPSFRDLWPGEDPGTDPGPESPSGSTPVRR
jgi:O-antigen ligase